PAGAVAEAFHDRLDGEARVLERLAASEQRAENVDEHDLAGEVAKMLLVERRHDLRLVGLEALLHQRAQRAVSRALDAVGDVELRKAEKGPVGERAWLEEATGLEKSQAMLVARRGEGRAIELVRPACPLVARGAVVPVIGKEGEEVAGDVGTRAGAEKPQRRT